jgi:hypothetical protein
MPRELLLCVPGPWEDRSDLVRAVASETKGEFMFAGMILANPRPSKRVIFCSAELTTQCKRLTTWKEEMGLESSNRAGQFI